MMFNCNLAMEELHIRNNRGGMRMTIMDIVQRLA